MAKFDPSAPLKEADVERLKELLRKGAIKTAIKLYAGLKSCNLASAERALTALQAEWNPPGPAEPPPSE